MWLWIVVGVLVWCLATVPVSMLVGGLLRRTGEAYGGRAPVRRARLDRAA